MPAPAVLRLALEPATVDAVLARDRAHAVPRAVLVLAASDPACARELDDALCGCGKPDCPNRTPDGFTIGRLLHVLRSAFVARDGERRFAPRRAPIPAAFASNLDAALLTLGDLAGAWDSVGCGCDDPACEYRDPRAATGAARLALLEHAWAVQMGCRHVTAPRPGAPGSGRLDRDAQALFNRALVNEAAHRLLAFDAAAVRRVAHASGVLAQTRWHDEANERVAHAVRDNLDAEPPAALRGTLLGAAMWTAARPLAADPAASAAFLHACSCLGSALLATQFAHPDVLAPFLAPFAGLLDFHALLHAASAAGYGTGVVCSAPLAEAPHALAPAPNARTPRRTRAPRRPPAA